MANVTLAQPPRRHWAPRPAILAGLSILVLVLGVLAVTGSLAQIASRVSNRDATAPAYSTSTVAIGSLTVSVTGTGPVAAANNVPLSFKESGKLTSIKVNVGDKVKQGQVLATLDTSDLQIALEQAQASLAQAQANLATVQSGSSDAAIAVAKTSVTNAKRAAADAQDALNLAQTSIDKDNSAAQIAVTSAQANLVTASTALAAAQDQETASLAADQVAIAADQKNLDAVNANVAAQVPVLQQQVEQAKDNLWSAQITRDATCGRDKGASCQAANASVAAAATAANLANSQLVYSAKQSDQQITSAQTSLDAAKAQLAKDRVSLHAAVVTAQNQVKQDQIALTAARASLAQTLAKSGQSLQSAQAQVNSAGNTVDLARASYDQSVAPPLPSSVDQAKAQVRNAQAAVDGAQSNLDEATLVAPFDGTIAAINGSLQQWVTGGAPSITSTSGGTTASATAIMTLFDLNSLQVTVDVNEADIGKVAIGDPVNFTLAAFPNQTFSGKVLTIQPVGTTISNVVNYSVTCSIPPATGVAIYPGMTATATIITAQRPNVLVVPNMAVSFANAALKQGLVQAPAVTRTPTPSRTGAIGSTEGTVITLDGTKLTPKAVTLGVTGTTHTEIISGLNSGDTVVVGGAGVSATGTSTGGGGQPRGFFGL